METQKATPKTLQTLNRQPGNKHFGAVVRP